MHVSAVRETREAPASVFLLVRKTAPNGESKTARVSKVMGPVGEETAMGISVPLPEEGEHRLQLSLLPVPGVEAHASPQGLLSSSSLSLQVLEGP